MQRVILHLDLDAFFAQAEELRRPSLKGKEVVVCMYSGRGELGGAVGTANYAARAKGVRSGMAIARARGLAPDAVYLPADIPYYRRLSEKVMAVLAASAERVQPVSLDEAYLDLSRATQGRFEAARALARRLKARVRKETGLTASVGVGPNKLVAKVASAHGKPDGLTVVRPGEVRAFLNPLPVGALPGVGQKTARVLKQWGVDTVEALARVDGLTLVEAFGKTVGGHLYRLARGLDDTPVAQREKKQLSRMATLPEDTRDQEALARHVRALAEKVWEKARKARVRYASVTLFLVPARGRPKTRTRSLPRPVFGPEPLFSCAFSLLDRFLKQNPQTMLRRVGVGVGALRPAQGQASLHAFAGSPTRPPA